MDALKKTIAETSAELAEPICTNLRGAENKKLKRSCYMILEIGI
jgi:hypothetical protein